MRRRVLPLLLALTAVAAVLAASAAGAKQDVTLNLVAYSTPRPVLDKLIAEFKKTPQGSGINIRGSYGPSSAQGQAVANGLPADGVILNTGNDINDLVDKGLDRQELGQAELQRRRLELGRRVRAPQREPEEGQGLERPARSPGVGVVTVNPFTGGIAKWNILAAYVAQRRLGKTDKQAIAYLQRLLQEQRRLAGLVGLERHEHVPLGQGRRAPHVRERGDQREDPVRDPAPDDADRHLHRRDPRRASTRPSGPRSRAS